MLFLTTTFSPTMLKDGNSAQLHETTLERAIEILQGPGGFISAVGHDVTAKILSALCGFHVTFNRANLALDHGDSVVAIIPNFRATEAREFTRDEVLGAGLRAFIITIQQA